MLAALLLTGVAAAAATPTPPVTSAPATSPQAGSFHPIGGSGAEAAFEFERPGAPNAIFSSRGAFGFVGGGLALTFEGAHAVAPAALEGGASSPGAIVYRSLYDGIDLVFRAGASEIKYEIRAEPGADLTRVALTYGQGSRLAIDPSGALQVTAEDAAFEDPAPVSVDAQGRAVDCAFELRGLSAFGFACPTWTRDASVTIDPIAFGTFLGGSGIEVVTGIQADAAGSFYVAGHTNSTDFVTVSAYDATPGGSYDVFVTKLSSDWRILYSTYYGGSGREFLSAFKVTPEGRVYLVGTTTNASALPLANATETNVSSGGFMAEFDTDGSLALSSLLPPNISQSVRALDIDQAGNVALVGGQGWNDTVFEQAYWFVMNGSTRIFGTVTTLGETENEFATAVSLRPDGEVVLLGMTAPPYFHGLVSPYPFPTTADAVKRTFSPHFGGPAPSEMFITRFSPNGTIIYSTLFGGDGNEMPASVLAGADGSLYITGFTDAPDFVTSPGALNDTVYNWSRDVFIMKFYPDYRGVAFCARFGGGDWEMPYGITLDTSRNVWIAGSTLSGDFPVTLGAYKKMLTGQADDTDAFVAKLNASGDKLLYGSLIGASNEEFGYGVAIDAFGNVVTAGETQSVSFPTTPDAFDTAFEPFGEDGFVVALDWRTFAVEVHTNPEGRTISINGYPRAAPYIDRCAIGSSLTVGSFFVQGDNYTRWTWDQWSDGVPITRNLTCVQDWNIEGRFITDYTITLDATPSGPTFGFNLFLDGAEIFAPATSWWRAGVTRLAEAPEHQALLNGLPGYRYTFTNWSDGGGRAHALTADGPANYTAHYVMEVFVTFATVPPGRAFGIDGSGVTGYPEYWWEVGSHHDLSAEPLSNESAGHRVAFVNWSDGEPASHGVAVWEPIAYTATFADEYFVTAGADPPSARFAVDGIPQAAPYQAWWRSGDSHLLAADAETIANGTRLTFSHWSDGGIAWHSAAVASPTDFKVHFFVDFLASFSVAPAGLGVVVDGVLRSPPTTSWWANGSEHRIAAAPPPQSQPGVRWAFGSWSDGGTSAHNVTASAPLNLTLAYIHEFKVEVHSAFGEPTCDRPDCWYTEGATATITVPDVIPVGASARHAFFKWEGDATGSTLPLLMLVNGTKDVTAAWREQYLLTVTSRFGTASGAGWYDDGAVALVAVTPVEFEDNGTRWRFDGWKGNPQPTASGSLTISGPGSLEAAWVPAGINFASAGAPLLALILIIAGAAGAFAVILLRRRRIREEEQP